MIIEKKHAVKHFNLKQLFMIKTLKMGPLYSINWEGLKRLKRIVFKI
jgi:hypothetical protein